MCEWASALSGRRVDDGEYLNSVHLAFYRNYNNKEKLYIERKKDLRYWFPPNQCQTVKENNFAQKLLINRCACMSLAHSPVSIEKGAR